MSLQIASSGLSGTKEAQARQGEPRKKRPRMQERCLATHPQPSRPRAPVINHAPRRSSKTPLLHPRPLWARLRRALRRPL